MSPSEQKIVIGMPLRDGRKTIKRAAESVLFQKKLKMDLVLLIANDNSTDDWRGTISEHLSDPRVIIVDVDLGSSYAVRNYIRDFVKENIPDACCIGRLDADDWLVDDFTLCRIEKIMDLSNPDVIIAGNRLSIEGKIIERTNIADKRLPSMDFLKQRLYQMSRGIPEGELPSCNTFIKPTVDLSYRKKRSAEDHWFTVDLILNQGRYKIHIAEDLLYAVYSLDGEITKKNRKDGIFLESRMELYEYFLKHLKR